MPIDLWCRERSAAARRCACLIYDLLHEWDQFLGISNHVPNLPGPTLQGYTVAGNFRSIPFLSKGNYAAPGIRTTDPLFKSRRSYLTLGPSLILLRRGHYILGPKHTRLNPNGSSDEIFKSELSAKWEEEKEEFVYYVYHIFIILLTLTAHLWLRDGCAPRKWVAVSCWSKMRSRYIFKTEPYVPSLLL